MFFAPGSLAGTRRRATRLTTLGPSIVALESSSRLPNAERASLLNAVWMTPARLLRRSAVDDGPPSVKGGREIARGPLEEMMKLAADRAETEASLLIIDCHAATEPLVWPEIRTLLAEPSFPVNI